MFDGWCHAGRVVERGGRRGPEPFWPRHCWALDRTPAYGPLPGILLAWKRDQSGTWWGQVAFAVPASQGATVQVVWVQARHLEPIERPQPNQQKETPP